jgi:hypothetical protein
VKATLERTHPKATIVKAERLFRGSLIGCEIKVKTAEGEEGDGHPR